MNMKRIFYLPCVAAGLVVLLLICAACTSAPSSQAPSAANTTTGGFSAVTTSPGGQPAAYTLEEAEAAALQANQSYFFLRGEHVDSSGKAGRWIFGVKTGNTSSMLVYDANGVSTIALPENLPAQGNIPAGILSPADIVRIASSSPNASSLDLNGGMATLQLANGEYTITGPGQANQGLVINATTGELMTTHG